jgi:hypothetical protein
VNLGWGVCRPREGYFFLMKTREAVLPYRPNFFMCTKWITTIFHFIAWSGCPSGAAYMTSIFARDTCWEMNSWWKLRLPLASTSEVSVEVFVPSHFVVTFRKPRSQDSENKASARETWNGESDSQHGVIDRGGQWRSAWPCCPLPSSSSRH